MVPAAYGSRLAGDLPEGRFAVFGAEHWPTLEVEFSASMSSQDGEITHPAPDGLVRFDPQRSRAVIPRLPGTTLEDLVHPNLTIAAFVAARARGDEAIHAGACAHAGGGWVFLGDHEQGKSTLLALLAQLGSEPLTDDLAVIRNGNVCAGARCLDLRPLTATQLGVESPARGNTRHRLALRPVRAEHPLRGFLHLDWAPRMSLTLLSGRERWKRLVDQIGAFPRATPARLLEFAELPHYELARPSDWRYAVRGASMVQAMMADASPSS